MAFDNILFDFDGTVFDTSPGVFNGIQFMLDYYGLKCDRANFPLMIGPPLTESFEHIIKMPKNMIPEAISKFREYYTEKGIFECAVYDGVRQLVESLRAHGKRVMIATSKPELFANQILERNGMRGLFDFVGGSDMEEAKRVEKIDVIRYVLAENGLENEEARKSTLMIGDRKYDVLGAHEACLECMGILWGFGNRAEFEDCHADYILETPEEVKRFLLSM